MVANETVNSLCQYPPPVYPGTDIKVGYEIVNPTSLMIGGGHAHRKFTTVLETGSHFLSICSLAFVPYSSCGSLFIAAPTFLPAKELTHCGALQGGG